MRHSAHQSLERRRRLSVVTQVALAVIAEAVASTRAGIAEAVVSTADMGHPVAQCTSTEVRLRFTTVTSMTTPRSGATAVGFATTPMCTTKPEQ